MHTTKKTFTLALLLVTLAAGMSVGCQALIGETPGSAPDDGFVELDDGARIYYQIEGEGTPLVLVHGYPLSGRLFRDQLDGLSDEYRVITFDLRGYGKSEAPGDEPSAGIETYASDVLAAMSELGVDDALIGGMSMGGPTVLSMYDMAPDRFMGMLLIDTIAAAASPPEAGTWRGLADVIRSKGVSAIPPLVLDEMLTGQARMNRTKLVNDLTTIINNASKQATLAGAQALASRPNFQPLLSEIDVPVLILVGLQDTIYPFEIARRMKRMIGDNATLTVIDDASHAAVFEEGEHANDAIRDWAGDTM